MKLRARTNGNEYQTDDPHKAYPLFCTEEQAREWVAAGILEVIEEAPTPKVEDDPPAKTGRQYKRRDVSAED